MSITVIPVNGINLKKSKYFGHLGKGHFTVKVTYHIYTIPAKHSYQYLSSIVMAGRITRKYNGPPVNDRARHKNNLITTFWVDKVPV